MPNKELTAKVKLNITDVDKKLKSLEDRIKKIQNAISGAGSNSGLDTKLMKSATQAEKLNQATARTQLLQQKVATEAAKTAIQQQKVETEVVKTATQQERLTQAQMRTQQQLDKIKTKSQQVENSQKKQHSILSKLNLVWARIKSNIQQTINKHQKLKSVLDRVKNNGSAIVSSLKRMADNGSIFNSKMSLSKSIFSGIWQSVKRIAGTLLSIQTVKLAITGADALTGAENRLNNIAVNTLGADKAYTKDGSGNITGYSNEATNFTKDAMDKMYAVAQGARTSYSGLMQNVSKTMTLAPEAFQNNIDYAIRFQEIMSKSYAVAGASATEMETSLYQLTQALSSGVLQGDELRSVREGAPLAYQEIEKFAQGVLNTNESLKDLAADGKISSEMVVAAVMNMGDTIDQQFALTKYRFTDVWTQIKSAGERAFQPVVSMFTDILNEAVDSGLVQKIEVVFTNIAKVVMIGLTLIKNGIKYVSESGAIDKIKQAFLAIGVVARWVGQTIVNVITWVVDNWNWLKWVLIAGLGILIALFIAVKVVSIIAAIASAIAWLTANWQILLVVAAVLLLIAVIFMWKNGMINTTDAISLGLLALAALAFLIFGWQVALVIALVAIILKYLNIFLGAVYVVVAAIWNIVVGIVNAIIQFFWTYFVEPWIGIIKWILNVCQGGFDSFGGAVANLIGNIISWFLSLGTVVTKIIDAIFGTNWTDGLNALKDKVLAWGKTENAITLERDAPTLSDIGVDRWGYSDAWNTGNEHGDIAKNWINDFGAQFQNEKSATKTEVGNITLDGLGEQLGLDFADAFNFPTEQSVGGGVGKDYDPDKSKLLGNIDDNTANMADSMELADEDLEYLRKVAEMEWKKEYTTRNVTIDMTNNNSINSELDVNGLMIKLRDTLREDFESSPDGVYEK